MNLKSSMHIISLVVGTIHPEHLGEVTKMVMMHSDGDVVVFWDQFSLVERHWVYQPFQGSSHVRRSWPAKKGTQVLFLFYLLLFVYNLVGFAFFFGAVVFYLLGLGGLLLYWDFGLFFEKELNVGWVGRKRWSDWGGYDQNILKFKSCFL